MILREEHLYERDMATHSLSCYLRIHLRGVFAVDETRDDMGGALRARIFLLFAMLIAITSIAGSGFVSRPPSLSTS